MRKFHPRIKHSGVIQNRCDPAVTSIFEVAAHESTRTTKLYDWRNDKIALEQIERIRL